MEEETSYFCKFLVEEGMNGVEICHKQKNHYGTDLLQRTQVDNCIKDENLVSKQSANLVPLETGLMRDLTIVSPAS
jgi:hypothetical protein